MVLKREKQSIYIVILLTTVFAIITAAFFVLLFCAKSMIVSTQLLNQRIELRGAVGLSDAEEALKNILNGKAKEIAKETYAQTLSELSGANAPSLGEQEALRRYHLKYAHELQEFCKNENLQEELLSQYRPEKGTVMLDPESMPEFEIVTNEESGEVTQCALRNVTFRYSYADRYEKSAQVDYLFQVPFATFYDGNDALFEYSMIARKGIYFTGKTSSVVGNIFAGTHSPEEYRKAEAGYGEREIYGGINVMATQLGIEADTVVSTGEINLKGAFVAFGTEEKPIEIYSGKINEIAGYFLRTNYTVTGEAHERNGETYKEAVDLINTAAGHIDEFNYYYDSENDEYYTGKYRKILSNTDVTLSGDFTGIVMTSGNVIIEADCNVEGLIYAGDRIYVQGNDNIVSNRDVMRRIIEEECRDPEADTIFDLKEYLGGITYKGMDCHEEMVAYAITK